MKLLPEKIARLFLTGRLKLLKAAALVLVNDSDAEVTLDRNTLINVLHPASRIESLTAASTLTAADNGKVFTLNLATGFATTLPAVAAGLHFLFFVGTAPSGGAYTIVTPGSANIIRGGVNELETDTGDDGPSVTAGDTITFADGVAVVGDHVELFCDGTYWYLRGQAAADGGVAPSQAS